MKKLFGEKIQVKKMENCQNGENIWVKKKDDKILGENNLGENLLGENIFGENLFRWKKMENGQNSEKIWVKKIW